MPQSRARVAVSLEAAQAYDILANPEREAVARVRQGSLDVEVRLDQDTVWIIMRREEQGGACPADAGVQP